MNKAKSFGKLIPVLILILLSLNTALLAGKKTKNEVHQAAELLLRNPTFSRIQLSPDSSHLAMYFIEDNKQNLYTWNLETKQPNVFKVKGSNDIYRFGWIDGDHIICGYSNFNLWHEALYLVEQDNKYTAIQLDEDFRGRALGLYDTLPYTDNIAILYDQAQKLGETFFRYNNKGRSFAEIDGGGGRVYAYEFDLKGDIRIKIVRGEKDNEWLVYYRRDNDSEWEYMEDFNKYTAFHGFDPSGKILYVSHRKENSRAVFQGYDVVNKKFLGKPIGDKAYSVRPWLIRLPKTGEIVGFSYDKDKPVIRYTDETIAKAMQIIQNALPDMKHVFMGFRPNGNILCRSWSDRQPTVIHDLDLKNMLLNVVVKTRPDINPEEMAEMKPFACKSSDGTTVIRGYFTLPPAHVKASKPYPAIVMVHGGPHARDYWCFDSEAQFFARMGYAVLQVNYRGSEDLYETRKKYTYIESAGYAVHDVADATKAMITAKLADPERIAIYGWSFGGYSAVASAIHHPDLYQCAVGAGGVYDFVERMKERIRDSGDIVTWSSDFYGQFPENKGEYAAISPVNNPDPVKIPIYLIHGKSDKVVRSVQSKWMHDALKKAGKDVTLDMPTYVRHGTSEDEARLKMIDDIFHFIDSHIGE